MSLEDLTGTGKGISDLVVSNPDGLDARSEGDNHIRGVKNVLLNTFGAMPAKSVSLPATGQVLAYDGAKYAPVHAFPVGMLGDFAMATAPARWLACDGAAVSRTTYAALFTAIGTTWGAGDGSTTFNVPNLNRRTTIGSGGTGTGTVGNAVGNTGGSETHTLTTGEIPAHSHSFTTGTDTEGSVPRAIASASGSFGGNNTGGGGAHNNMQPVAVVKKCIYAGV